jgi:mRNA-degrading endonuclease toxin of MazEF toxin-antitoxin module
MKRGEVWWIGFEPSLRGKVRKKPPALIMSNDAANKNLNRLQVVPLTTAVDRMEWRKSRSVLGTGSVWRLRPHSVG